MWCWNLRTVFQYNHWMRFTTLFFDLDDTLYPHSTGLWPAIKDRMNLYMIERLDIPESDVPFLREQYFKMYGTTLRGLEARHNVDKDDFMSFVHDLPLQEYLSPNPIVREVIRSLPTRNFIFTNADVSHARRVLAALQLEDLFETIVDVNTVKPYCKPMPESFAIAMDLAEEWGIADKAAAATQEHVGRWNDASQRAETRREEIAP